MQHGKAIRIRKDFGFEILCQGLLLGGVLDTFKTDVLTSQGVLSSSRVSGEHRFAAHPGRLGRMLKSLDVADIKDGVLKTRLLWITVDALYM